MSEFCLIYVTTKDLDEAKLIAKNLVGEKSVACANILPSMLSMYWWEGKLCEDFESVLLLKARTADFSKLQKKICALHSYTTSCVLRIDIADGNPEYLKWLGQSFVLS